MSRTIGSALRWAVASAALLLSLHAAVVAAWYGSVLPDLEVSPHARRLEVATLGRLPPAPLAWPWLVGPGFRLRVPMARVPGGTPCGAGCRVPLASGVLTLQPRPRPWGQEEAERLLAPDPSSVSLLRSPLENWASMLAVTRHVTRDARPLRVRRFRARQSQGLVVDFSGGGIVRHVVYAYTPSGVAAPLLTFSRVHPEALRSMLGSLEPVRPAGPVGGRPR